jgi:hypothetical protein
MRIVDGNGRRLQLAADDVLEGADGRYPATQALSAGG